MDERESPQTRNDHRSGTPDAWPRSASDAARLAGVNERTIRSAISRSELVVTRQARAHRIARARLERYRRRTDIGSARAITEQGPAPIPVPGSPLIGRADERATVRGLLLREGVRLVTLIGPGGVGKTRLAQEIAREVVDLFADGACFVDLSPVRDPRLVLPAIAQAIGIRGDGRRALDETVRTYLQSREYLLLLDNCEQVAAAGHDIAALTAGCPALRILATSRSPLRIRDEHRFPLDPLPLPTATEAEATTLSQSDAVRLFVERSQAVSPGAHSATDLRAIAAICRRLDGLPLAIELAAAWSALLPPPELLARLAESMRLPGREPRDLPGRQRTVRDTVAWSYDLLPPPAQALFRRLAVFTGGFDLDAAIAIADVPDGTVLDLLGGLVEQSLLRRVEAPDGGARFTMLETVREFAAQQLDEHGETAAIRSRHAEHYRLLAEHIEDVLWRSAMRHSLDRFETERPNFLAALAWFAETGDATRELSLACPLGSYWIFRGHVPEGIGALDAALARGAGAPAEPLGTAMAVQAILLMAVGATEQADRLSAATVALAREKWGSLLGFALWVRAGVVGRDDERIAEAIAMLQEGADLGSGQEFPSWDQPVVLSAMGTLWIRLGDRERGVRLINDALRLLPMENGTLHTGETFLQLGQLDRLDGRTAEAAGHLAASLRAYREAGVETTPCFVLAELAWAATARGYQETAARLDGMIQAIVDRAGPVLEEGTLGVIWLVERPTRTDTRHTYPVAFDAGRALAFDAAISEAIAIADALAAGNPPPGAALPRLSHAPARLSAREQHVLTLLAQRYTAPEIADQLFLSVRTVERHISNLYNKLGANSRREAVAAASHFGLV